MEAAYVQEFFVTWRQSFRIICKLAIFIYALMAIDLWLEVGLLVPAKASSSPWISTLSWIIPAVQALCTLLYTYSRFFTAGSYAYLVALSGFLAMSYHCFPTLAAFAEGLYSPMDEMEEPVPLSRLKLAVVESGWVMSKSILYALLCALLIPDLILVRQLMNRLPC